MLHGDRRLRMYMHEERPQASNPTPETTDSMYADDTIPPTK